MPCRHQLMLAATALLSVTQAVPLSIGASVRVDPWSPTPVNPSQDPWYTAPKHFDCAPGTVLKIRPAPGNASSILQNVSAVWNILYATTDSQYNPSWAVTTLFVPQNPNPKALLSYQIPYDSANVNDSPSVAIYGKLQDFSAWQPALREGWFLTVPDYEGPNASFTAGVMSGHATLDSIRAVLSLKKKFGLDHHVNYALWGYSGGALASEWAAELQLEYAHELNFAGVAIGGLTPNLTSVLASVTGTVAAGLAPSSILGITSQYPEVRDLVVSKLKTEGPYNATSFLSALTLPATQTLVTFAFQNISQFFVDGALDIMLPMVNQILYRDGIMGYHGVPQMPLYVYKAIQDEISPIADTDAVVERFCGIGANILYERNSIGGHSAEGTNGALSAFAFLASVLGGTYNSTYQTQGCTVRDVAVNITDSAL